MSAARTLAGRIVRIGTFEARGEEVTGVIVEMSFDQLRTLRVGHWLYQPVTVTVVPDVCSAATVATEFGSSASQRRPSAPGALPL
jgi:hypothetical protein